MLHPNDAASERDRRFFESHPDRTARIRRALPGEWPYMTAPAFVIAWRIADGVCARVPFSAKGRVRDGEAEACALLQLVAPIAGAHA
jgi:hypothetical protein